MQRADTKITYAETMLERVLLAIIAAHPSSEMERCLAVRLQDAMSMLLGSSPTQWEAAEKALTFIARERQRDICDVDMSMLATGSDIGPSAARSVSELADIAAHDVLGLNCVSEISAATNYLCHAYRRDAALHPVEYDHALEAMQDEAVHRILTELAEWDVFSISKN